MRASDSPSDFRVSTWWRRSISFGPYARQPARVRSGRTRPFRSYRRSARTPTPRRRAVSAGLKKRSLILFGVSIGCAHLWAGPRFRLKRYFRAYRIHTELIIAPYPHVHRNSDQPQALVLESQRPRLTRKLEAASLQQTSAFPAAHPSISMSALHSVSSGRLTPHGRD